MIAIANAEAEEMEALERGSAETQTREELREALRADGAYPSPQKKWAMT